MKKRLLSMLLAAALAVSAVPAMALAVTADEGANTQTNLLAGIEPDGTTVVKDTVVDSGDYYLHVGNRPIAGNGAGFSFLPDRTDSATYYVEFDARNSIDAMVIKTDDSGNSYSEECLAGKHFRADWSANNKLMSCVSVTDVNGKDCTATYSTPGVNDKSPSDTQNIYLDSEWRHYVLTYTGAVSKFRFQGRSTNEVVNYDIDNFEVYVKDSDGNKTYIHDLDFEDEKVTGLTASSADLNFSVLEKEDYNYSESGEVTYAVNNVAESGIYTLTGDVRYACSYETTSGVASAIVTATAVVDGEELVLGTADVTSNEWTPITGSVVIPNGNDVEISLVTTVTGTDGVVYETPLDFKNMSLVCSEPLTDLELEATLVDTDNLLNGATVTSKASKLTQHDGDLYIPERSEADDAHFMKFVVPGDFKKGETYYLTFDASIEDITKTYESDKGFLLRMGINTTDVSAVAAILRYVTTTEASIEPIKFVPTADLTSITLNVNRGYDVEISAMWIDNFKIYQEVNGEEVSVYEYSFDDVNNVEEHKGSFQNGGRTYSYYSIFDDLLVYCKVAPEITPKYFDIAATNAISLNVDAANIELNAADYDFTTGVMALDSSKTGEAYAVITLSNGETTKEITTATVNVNAEGYAEIAERFTLADGYYIESIDIITDIVGNVRILTPVVELATYGDADGDGEVGLTDATLLAKYIAKWDVSDDIDLTVLDVYHDGEVNSLDLIVMTRHLAGWGKEDETYATLPYFPAN